MDDRTLLELWKDIPGYSGKYQASDLGNIKSLKRKGVRQDRILTPWINDKGYLQVTLDGVSKHVSVLIGITFLGHVQNGYKGMVVDHIDNNPLNNKLSNLQIITRRKNVSKDTWRNNITSKYTGVSWAKEKNKWLAQIGINGKQTYLGRFKEEIDAHNAYQKALKELV